MFFSRQNLCLTLPLAALVCPVLVSAIPRQTPAPVKIRQPASTDTVEPDVDEDPDYSIDNTDKLRNGERAAVQ